MNQAPLQCHCSLSSLVSRRHHPDAAGTGEALWDIKKLTISDSQVITDRLSSPWERDTTFAAQQLLVIHIQKTLTIQQSQSTVSSSSKHCDQSLCSSSTALLKSQLFKIKISYFSKTLKPLKDGGVLAAKASIVCSNTNGFGIF